MTEVIISRNLTTLLSGFAFLIGAVFCWVAPGLVWADYVGVVLILFGLGLLYRWIFPIQSRLVVDEHGVRWWLGGQQQDSVQWPEIRRIKQSRDDDSFRMDIGRVMEIHIPFQFLRTKKGQEEFAQELSRYRPDMTIEQI